MASPGQGIGVAGKAGGAISQPLRMLLIHQAFASPSDGGGTRHYEFAQRVLSAGHSFTVVASDLNYLSGTAVSQRRGLYTEEAIDGLRVLRAYAYPSLHRSFIWRVFSFFTFTASSFLTAIKSGPVDLVVGTSPPIFQALAAWAVAFLRGRPFLLEIRDLWPEFAIDIGVLRNSILVWFSRRLERFLYARAAHIIVNSPAYRDYLLDAHVPRLKISLVSNGVDASMFDPNACGEWSRDKWQLKGKVIISYAGAIGLANDLCTVIRAAERLRLRDDIVFLIAGDGKERPNLEAEVSKRALKNVIFTGRISKGEVAQVMAMSDACIAILKDIPMFRTTYPNKVFDYMAAGRPTLLAIDGVIREVIEGSNSGLFIPPGDEVALANAVLRIVADPVQARQMGLRGRAHVIKYFNRDEQAAQFLTLVEDIVRQWRGERHRFYRHFGKRALDLMITVPCSVVLIPIFFLIALIMKLTTPGPLFFKQLRLGRLGKPFVAYKFRTMTHCHRTHHVEIREDNPEVTAIGKLLRRFKMDELPQLFNVLKGDMSLIGPRPPLLEQLGQYDSRTVHRLDLRPGLTGLAQVSGNIGLSWPQRWTLDLQYVEGMSLQLDIKIILRTIVVLLLGEKHYFNPDLNE